MRKKLFNLLYPGNHPTLYSKLLSYTIIFLIIINVVIFVVESFKNLSTTIIALTNTIELLTIIIFTFEYICRFVTADLLYPSLGAIKSRLKFVFSFLSIIDLCAILPFFIPFFTTSLLTLRSLRLLRLLRLFKLSRYTNALFTVGLVLKNKSYQLITSFFVVALILIISSIIMYNIEYAAQPTVFENAFSGFWWSVSTITTVGYGDIFPVTFMGKLLSSFISFLGIGMVAIPTGIISAGFNELTSSNNETYVYCPHCGKKL
jgi:voltage-gated potassium channel